MGSPDARSCGGCELHASSPNVMKTLFALLLVGTGTLILAACGTHSGSVSGSGSGGGAFQGSGSVSASGN
jgi:hypothetical protein